MNTTKIDIQGTFDIAKGRNTLRKFIMAQRWSPTFNARASTALTALGELIICSSPEHEMIEVQVYILDTDDDTGIEMNCQIPILESGNLALETAQDRLKRAADHLFINNQGRTWQVALQVWGAN